MDEKVDRLGTGRVVRLNWLDAVAHPKTKRGNGRSVV